MLMIANLFKSAAVLALGLALTHTTARAAVTVDLTLNPLSGSAGSGTLTLASFPGTFVFLEGGTGPVVDLTGLDITIGALTFDLGDAITPPTPGGAFAGGVLTDLTYVGSTISGMNTFTLTSGILGIGYIVTDKSGRGDPRIVDSGYITASVAPAPEPASFVLLGSLLIGVSFSLRKRLSAR